MTESLDITEVVRRTGLTSRALRFYEARRLIAPLRTASGRRYYDAAQLERIHQIVTLKKAGLSLTQIGALLSRRPIDTATLLRQQLENLDAKARDIAIARATLNTALSRIESGEPLDSATLCSLIHQGEKIMEQEKWAKVIDRYYSPEEQAEWLKATAPMDPKFSDADYHQQWKDLSARIAAAMPMDADSDQALKFVREWFKLLEPFSKVATPEMWQGNLEFYSKMPEWEGEVDTGFSSQVWNFIGEATAAARAAGADIGPTPAWMQQGDSV
ncbi:MAG: MerR family transcriptional regulator [Parasphingorhabdus sp.]|nr:MerR family transcriptional regulator [Parasphingorhabdus sp.]